MISPTTTQSAAIADIKDWYHNRTKQQQVYRLFGWAGVGKTSVLKYAIAELGITSDLDLNDTDSVPPVLYAAFTGKAARVMTRKGTPASTIHSLIYRVSEATKEEIEKLKAQVSDLRSKLNSGSSINPDLDRHILGSLELRLKDIHRPKFILNSDSIVKDCKLIVLDEVSMVDERMAMDLLSFGKPILCLGDPGQLPPIKGQGYFTMARPDTMLTEVHRQALESPILRLATMARNGEHIPYAAYSNDVWKMSRRNFPASGLLKADQVICAFNATRRMLNNQMRAAAGFDGYVPTGPQEKVICLKNMNDFGIVNGEFLTLDEVEIVDDNFFRATVMNEDGKYVSRALSGRPDKMLLYRGHYSDHFQYDPDRERNDYWLKKQVTMVESSWGNAITCHKSQGSQYNSVIVFDESFGRTQDDRNKWLYTAITRAEEKLLILA